MASAHQAPEPEPLFSLEPDRQPGEPGDSSGDAPNVVPFKSFPKDADDPGSPGARSSREYAARHATRGRNMPKAVAIPTGDDCYVSLADAAEFYGVSPETLRRRIGEGALPAVKGGYNLIRVLLSDVAKLFPPISTVDPDGYPK